MEGIPRRKSPCVEKNMKIWVDDVRPAPEGYVWVKSVNQAKRLIEYNDFMVSLVDLDHDAGGYAEHGGDYIRLLDWFEEIGWNPPSVRIHSMNPVGRENMRRVIRKNGWREVM